ncbi:MAG: hypothetical protein HYY01_08675 [Chloroflexi bacterium]|nr:hypothetical protein [Chloroflexota bacterium]
MPDVKTPQYIMDLLRPMSQQSNADRRVWSIPLQTVWVPFFTATNVVGQTRLADESLGAPLRLAKDKDGAVRFTKQGRPVISVAKELSTNVRMVRENFQAGLVAFTSHVRKANAEGYKSQVERALAAGQPIVESDGKALVEAISEREEAEAKASARAPQDTREPVAA